MPSFDASKGQRVDIVVRGYVDYNAGGYLKITHEPDDVQSGALDIPEWMIVAEPVKAPLWPNGTLLLTDEGGDRSPLLVRYIVDEPGMARGFSVITGGQRRMIGDTFSEKEFLVGRDPKTFTRLRKDGED